MKILVKILPVPPLLSRRGQRVPSIDGDSFVGDWIHAASPVKKIISNQYAEIRTSLTSLSLPHSSFPWRTPLANVVPINGVQERWEEQEMELEAVCLSRLYFALNRIQGSLQIDKKKKKRRETSILECSKSRNDTCTKKDKMKRKHSSGVRKCRRRERSASWMESPPIIHHFHFHWIASRMGYAPLRDSNLAAKQDGASVTRFRPIGRPIVL